MDGSEGGSGGYRPSGNPPTALPPQDQRRPPPPLHPPPAPVYTPYNPFLHSSTTSPYPSQPPITQPFPLPPLSHPNPLPDAASDSLAPSPTSSRGTSGTDFAALSALYGVSLGGAAASLGGEVSVGDAASPEATGTLAAPKVTKKADRSCKTCRQRRVRCGREYPTCTRCLKRKDECSYGEGVYVEETIEGSDQQKITELEGKISSLEQQIRTSSSSTASRPPTGGSAPSPPPGFTRSTLSASLAQCITSLLPRPQDHYLTTFLLEDRASQPTFDGVEQRLAGAAFADALTCYLLDAARRACDSRLPAFVALTARVDAYKNRLRDLEPAQQVSVAVLCALGARTCAHPPVFGVTTVLLPDNTPSPPLFTTVGSRRELACQAMESRAKETAWAAGLLWPKNHEELEALVGLMGLSLHEENKPQDSRFLVRQVVGAFLDLRHGELSRGVVHPASQGVATSAFMADALTSVSTGKPAVISSSEMNDYFATAGIELPDLAQSRLGQVVEQALQKPLNSATLTRLINSLFLHVVSCWRVFSQVTSPRRASSTPVLGFIRNLWTLLDQIHNAIQRLQQHLVSLATPLPGAETDEHAINHAILLAVRADDTLVVLIMHMHRYLVMRRDDAPYWTEREGDEELERVRAESTLRVYKCLKLLAFYCQLHFSSQDKHNVFHLMLQLDVLQNWTTLATLRIGQPGGPISDEFEVTEEEVEWFRQALELSLFYTPRTGMTLNALNGARAAHFPKSAAPPPSSSAFCELQHFLSKLRRPLTEIVAAPTTYDTASIPSPLPPSAASQQSFPSPASTSASGIPAQHNSNANTPTPLHPQQQSVPNMYSHAADPQHLHLPAGTPIPFLPQDPSHIMQEDVAMPFPLDIYGQSGFADGAGEDLPGTSTDVRSAFRSIDFGDLSLTPAAVAGSDGSNSSIEEWMRRKH
ncbi:hypothetical protein JCM6882_003140 [Rhodosporidiobolus microsporus]